MSDEYGVFAASIVGEPDANPLHVPERLVQDIWGKQRFRTDGLQCTTGSKLTVEAPGQLNTNQGPDFKNAAVRIGDVLWRGSVEIHRCSAEWYRHGHDKDALYNNVILHVTLIPDRQTGQLRRQDGSIIPEIVLMPRLDAPLRTLAWDHEVQSHRYFPCEQHWPEVPTGVVEPFLLTLVRDRLKIKTARIATRVELEPDLDQVLYEEVFRSLGYMPNAESMVILARRVPLSLLKSLDSGFDRMCLLLGVSGLVPAVSEFVHGDRSAIEYALLVRDRFVEINMQTDITPLPRQTWKLSRMRPNNFPAVRIAQAAALFYPGSALSDCPVNLIIQAVRRGRVEELANEVLVEEPETYWRNHVSLLKQRRRPSSATVGPDRRVTIIVNAFLPVALFAMRSRESRGALTTVQRLLENLPAQEDSVTKPYVKRRGLPTSAAITQALHELSGEWCRRQRCVECPVGRYLSRQGFRFGP